MHVRAAAGFVVRTVMSPSKTKRRTCRDVMQSDHQVTSLGT